MDAAEAVGEPAAPRPSRGRRLLRSLPPARLAWILLAAIAVLGVYYLHGLGIASLLGIPVVAALADLAYQRVRFSRIRWPDAALVTGLLVALVFPPTAPLLATGALALAAVTLRHALRLQGRPWFNPAATAIVGGTLAFGLAPAWWVGIGPDGVYVLIGLGAVLLARSRPSWIPAIGFLVTYALLSVVQHVAIGASTDPRVLLLAVLDPATVFFALFMVSEPRTSPGGAPEQVIYAGTVGMAAVFLPLFLPSLGILVALLIGNGVSVGLRAFTARTARPSREVSRERRRAAARSAEAARARWPVGYRVGAGFFAVVFLLAVVGLTPAAPNAAPLIHVSNPGGSSGGGSGGTLTSCTTDNPAIASATISSLHQLLGPSVILSYDQSTGVVTFYDPVNHVTVTETDLYEDYGFAEFNGDDLAVSGCQP